MSLHTPIYSPESLPGPHDIARRELPNGIVVLARENWASPSVVLSGALRAGSLFETRDKAGLANFHAHMLMRGTRGRTFEELYEEIESIGASLGTGSAKHTASFGGKSLAEDLPTILGLVSDVLRDPTFPAEHVEKVRGEILTALEVRAHDTRSMAALTFHELAYPPDHPYTISNAGYVETVSAITRDEIVAFHQRHVGPRGMIVVIVGAVRAEQAIALVEDVLGDWQNPAQPDPPPLPDAPRLAEARARTVTIPGKTQTDIVLGWPGPARNAPDYRAARVANNILGVFGLYGRLGDSIREQEGLAYYSYSKLQGGLGPGPWRVIAGVNPAKVERAIEIIRTEIRRMVETPVTAEELADNKTFFKGSLPLSLETNEGVASHILLMELHGLGLDYLQRYADEVDAVTAEDVLAAARHYLAPDAYALAIAGPPTE
jgi:zinc protease